MQKILKKNDIKTKANIKWIEKKKKKTAYQYKGGKDGKHSTVLLIK